MRHYTIEDASLRRDLRILCLEDVRSEEEFSGRWRPAGLDCCWRQFRNLLLPFACFSWASARASGILRQSCSCMHSQLLLSYPEVDPVSQNHSKFGKPNSWHTTWMCTSTAYIRILIPGTLKVTNIDMGSIGEWTCARLFNRTNNFSGRISQLPLCKNIARIPSL